LYGGYTAGVGLPVRAIRLAAPRGGRFQLGEFLFMSDFSAAQSAPISGAFSIGGCLRRALSTFFANFISFNLLGLIVMVPGLVVLFLLFGGTFLALMAYDPATSAAPPEIGGDFAFMILGGGLIMLILQYLLTGAVVYGTLQHLDGQRPSIASSLSQALRRIVPIVLVAIVSMILVWIGMVLLIVPGIIIALMLCVAIPVVMVEGRGVFASMSRSRALTKGARWRLLGLFLVAVIGTILLTTIISMVVALVMLFLGPVGMTISTIVDVAIQLFTTVFLAVLLAVTYHDLRVAKEGVSTAQLAAVFD
jgi:hypothetical protein